MNKYIHIVYKLTFSCRGAYTPPSISPPLAGQRQVVCIDRSIYGALPIYLCMYVCMYVSIYLSVYLYTHTHTHIYIYIYIYVYIYMNLYVCICIY